MRRRTSGRRGVAMVIVIVLVAVATILGMAYLQSSSVRRMGSSNLPAATQAKYLAESGLQHAMYKLQTDLPAMVSSSESSRLGSYFLSAASASYTFYAEPVSGQIGKFVLHAEGDSGGIKQKSSAMVRIAAAPEVTTSFAMMVDNELTTPSCLTVKGDIYAKKIVRNFSTVTGNLSSSAWVWDLFSRVEGLVLRNVPPVALLRVSAPDYSEYTLFETTYNWTSVEGINVLGPTSLLANGGAITAGNPGGVVRIRPEGGTLTLEDDLQFQGTLIVEGDIRLDGTNIKLTAVDGFPAVICTKKILAADGAEVVIEGLVKSHDGIKPDEDGDVSKTEIRGGLLSDTVGYDSALLGTHEVQYVPDRCRIYDFSETAGLPKLEVLRWDD